MTDNLIEILGRIEKELGVSIQPVAARERFSKFTKMFSSGTQLSIFGAGQAGVKMKKFLESKYLVVSRFIDNNPQKNDTQFEGIPVFSPTHLGKEGLQESPIFIASMYFPEIIKQLQEDFNLVAFEDFFVPHLFLFEVNVMGQGYNADLQDNLRNHWPAILETQALWEDDRSRWLFWRYLYLRLYFLTPEKLQRELFEYNDPELFKLHQKIEDEELQSAIKHMFQEGLYDFGKPNGYGHQLPTPVTVTPGDHVIDGGAWVGDTAILFAVKTGPKGKVWSFEPTEHHANRIRTTSTKLGLDPIIHVKTAGLWSSTETLKFADSNDADGAGSFISSQGTIEIPVLNLDTFIGDQRVDYMKLDIEGSELEALKGAKGLLKKWKPKLAICLYHRAQDLHEIPLFLKELDLGYRFYFTHRGTTPTDAILFAWSDQQKQP